MSTSVERVTAALEARANDPVQKMTPAERWKNAPAKSFGDAKIERMPAEDRAIVARAEAAHAAMRATPEDPATVAEWLDAKTALVERRRYWRQIGEATGARRGVLILNYEDGV